MKLIMYGVIQKKKILKIITIIHRKHLKKCRNILLK